MALYKGTIQIAGGSSGIDKSILSDYVALSGENEISGSNDISVLNVEKMLAKADLQVGDSIESKSLVMTDNIKSQNVEFSKLSSELYGLTKAQLKSEGFGSGGAVFLDYEHPQIPATNLSTGSYAHKLTADACVEIRGIDFTLHKAESSSSTSSFPISKKQFLHNLIVKVNNVEVNHSDWHWIVYSVWVHPDNSYIKDVSFSFDPIKLYLKKGDTFFIQAPDDDLSQDADTSDRYTFVIYNIK